MKGKTWLILYTILFLIKSLKVEKDDEEKCIYSFSCENNKEFCATKTKTESKEIYDIKISKCEKSFCDYKSLLFGNKNEKIKCLESQKKFPSYIGGVCENDDNCLNGICVNKTCQNSGIGEECISHEECPLNSACINGTCKNYTKYGESCISSYECDYDLFCNKFTKSCDKLFKFKDGENITKYFSGEDIIENLCETGGYIKIQEGNNITYQCATLKNEGIDCDKICYYNIILDGNKKQIYSSKEKCQCSFNKYRTKHCVLGNGEKAYQEYFKEKKSLRNQNLIKLNCHTLERNINDICFNLLNTNKSVNFRNFNKYYNNLKINALQYHRFHESEECIKKEIFGYDENPVIPESQSCPRFICKNDLKQCGLGINPMNEGGIGISITLNDNLCAKGEICSGMEENKIGIEDFDSLIMTQERLDAKCKIYQNSREVKRYPGEDCNFDEECFIKNKTSLVSVCVNSKCTGRSKGERCSSTDECLVGLYCDSSKDVCLEQKLEGESCKEGFDCKNYLGCYRTRCIKFGTLKKGMGISEDLAPFPGQEDKRELLCSTGESYKTDTGSFCVENNYRKDWLESKNKNDILEDGKIVKCNYGDSCWYDNGKNKIEKNCTCGYNDNGQGYCEIPSELIRDKYIEYVKFKGEMLNNGCHSKSRFDCYLKKDINTFYQLMKHKSETKLASKFYGASSCVQKIFLNEKFINYNHLFYLLILILF